MIVFTRVYFFHIITFLLLCIYPGTVSAESKGYIDIQTTIDAPVIQFILPIPNYLIPIGAEIKLSEQKVPVNIRYKALNNWVTLDKEKYVRSLLVEVRHIEGENLLFQLSWSSEKSDNSSENLVMLDQVRLVYPSMNWLARSVLLHPKSELSNSDWYTEPQSFYANYVINKKLLKDKGYPPEKSSQWLFDRPQAIYQLFIMTGNSKWFDEANLLADFYIRNIDEKGDFIPRKKYDPKFFMPKGLLYKYFLTGDPKAKLALIKLYQRSLKWDPNYFSGRGFWTERNQAAALNTAISYWEMTGDKKALERIDEIIDATVAMTFNPVNDWPLRSCPQHSFNSHEGYGDNSAACSPWMMALLSDALWRYYRLTEDVRSAALIDAFGDFVLNYGIFWGDERVKNIIIPKYIVSLDNIRQEEHNQWSDPQHTCDVAALIGKSVYVKEVNKKDSFILKELFEVFVTQCKSSYFKLKSQHKKPAFWVVQPPRRFGWTYSTTSDLPWLNSLLLELD